MSARVIVIAVAFALLTLMAPQALACSVCFDANEQRRSAFLITTLLLTFTPLLFVFSVVWWLKRRARALEPLPPAE